MIKRLLFYLLFLPVVASASVPATSRFPENNYTNVVARNESRVKKDGFLKRWAKKRLQKRLGMLLSRSDEGTGLGFALIGVGIGIILVALFIVFPYVGFYAAAPGGLVGLLFSIMGLRKANQWQNPGASKGWAKAGIIINSIVIGAYLLILGLING